MAASDVCEAECVASTENTAVTPRQIETNENSCQLHD